MLKRFARHMLSPGIALVLLSALPVQSKAGELTTLAYFTLNTQPFTPVGMDADGNIYGVSVSSAAPRLIRMAISSVQQPLEGLQAPEGSGSLLVEVTRSLCSHPSLASISAPTCLK